MKQPTEQAFSPGSTVAMLKGRLAEMNYSQATIERMDSVWENFSQYWNSMSNPEFSLKTIQEFILSRYGFQMGDKDSCHNVNRSMGVLWDFVTCGQVFTVCSLNRNEFRTEYREAIEGFVRRLVDSGYSQGSLRTFRSQLFKLSEYLHYAGVANVGAITEEHLKGYEQTLDRHAPRTRVRELRLLKRFLEYCLEVKIISEPLALTVPKIRVPRNTELPTVFTKEEVQALLSNVDRENPLGKRDYAILSIAAGLGMRVSDILGLTFTEIDWANKRLSIVQQKTGKVVELPLTESIGWAIIDYLQNGRPVSANNHVFIKHCAPYDELSPSMHRTLKKYMKKAGIECSESSHKGMHTFRHSLASSMLQSGISLPIISGTLGHADPRSTETYLRIDLTLLQKCALEVE